MDWEKAAVILVGLIQVINKCQGLSGAAISVSKSLSEIIAIPPWKIMEAGAGMGLLVLLLSS